MSKRWSTRSLIGSAALAEGDRVELRAFVTFSTKALQERAARNPKTVEVATVAAKRGIHCKPGKTMQARLNLEKRWILSDRRSGS
jgi:nucleoid DNA-binding protein